MNTKAITIFFDPKNPMACNVNVNKRFLKAGTTSKANVIEKTMSWLQASYVKIAHQLLDSTEKATTATVPLKRKRGRPARALQMEAQNQGQMVKRRRGRPARSSINPAAIMNSIENITTTTTTVKRGVGRPKRVIAIPTTVAMEMPNIT